MKRKILLIIEDIVMATLIQEILQECGHEVVIESNSELGITLAEKTLPDQIICYLSYSNIRPSMILNRLAITENTAKIGFISMGNKDRQSEILYPECYRHLSVPFLIGDLLRAIDSLSLTCKASSG
jgi:CheY-like chemotaxis protein